MKPSMTARVKSYLDARRALGYKLHTEGGMLLNFARYADRTQHQSPLTSVLALRWATLPRRGDPLYRARRLEVVRVFAKYLATLEPATEIPPRHVLGPAHKQRRRPHFYTTAQILSLMSLHKGVNVKFPAILRIEAWLVEAICFRQTEHQVHVLQRRAGLPLYQVVDV